MGIAASVANRKELAVILERLINECYPFIGASDHGVSKAIYLDDPDGNGIESYWNRPENQWPYNDGGTLNMYTRPLDIKNLLQELE